MFYTSIHGYILFFRYLCGINFILEQLQSSPYLFKAIVRASSSALVVQGLRFIFFFIVWSKTLMVYIEYSKKDQRKRYNLACYFIGYRLLFCFIVSSTSIVSGAKLIDWGLQYVFTTRFCSSSTRIVVIVGLVYFFFFSIEIYFDYLEFCNSQ